MIGWIADSLRFFWSLLYWNARKTVFRARRGRSPCPCQNPSDSGRAMETGCDASLGWHQPSRFRHVCPLLKRNAAGQLRCSVDTPDVRPFWIRATVFFAATIVSLYLAGTVAVFAFQRTVGKPISYRQVAWPPAWKEYPQVQSRYFAAKARQALAARNVNEAILSLSLAYELDPSNYGAGFALARLWQIGQPALADRVFAQLAHEHPEQRGTTLAAWYRSLLARADFGAVVSLATDALKTDPAHADAWLHALLFAFEHQPDDRALRALANDTTLPDGARHILALELATRVDDREQARAALLREPVEPTYSYFDYYRPHRLIELGFPDDALKFLQRPDSRLADRDRTALWLDAQARRGWTPAARGEVINLLDSSFTTATVELLCAHVIRHPDHELFQTLFLRMRSAPAQESEAGFGAYFSLFCAAGASGDGAQLQDAKGLVKKMTGTRFDVLDAVERFFRTDGMGSRIEVYLPALQPLPLEVVYALLDRYYQPRPAAANSAP